MIIGRRTLREAKDDGLRRLARSLGIDPDMRRVALIDAIYREITSDSEESEDGWAQELRTEKGAT